MAQRGPDKFSPTKLGKGIMGGPTAPQNSGPANARAKSRNETLGPRARHPKL